jgi:hypothetical protein
MMCPSPLATVFRDETAGTDSGWRAFASVRGEREPRLQDLMNDPITHRLMASDGVKREHLATLLMDARAKLAVRRL